MAWFEVDIYEKCVELDLHNYSKRTALIVVREKIKEAFEHGFKNIRLIHGARTITDRNEGGSIKYQLRTMIKNGELDKWIEKKNSIVKDGYIILELKKNPAPTEREWNELPLEEY